MLAVLGTGHLLLVLATGSELRFGLMLIVAGAAIAPTLAITFGMVDELAPAGTVTEAFAWLATAEAVGSAVGSAAGRRHRRPTPAPCPRWPWPASPARSRWRSRSRARPTLAPQVAPRGVAAAVCPAPGA